MVVTKILETTLAAGVTSVQFTDSDIPNSLIRVFCSDADLIYTSLSLTGNTLTVTYPAQSVNKSIALEVVKAGLDIVDNLTTDDATKALSAKQGKALNDKIDGLDLEDLYNVSVTEAENGDILTYYGGEWINAPGKNNITDMDDVAVSTLQDGQVLAWDDTEGKFVNVNQSGGGSAYTYSETEHVVGKWLDGNDIYEISLVTTSTVTLNNSSWTTVFSRSGIAKMISSECVRYTAGGDYIATGCNAFNNNGNIQFQVLNSNLSMSAGSIFTIRYTKTS